MGDGLHEKKLRLRARYINLNRGVWLLYLFYYMMLVSVRLDHRLHHKVSGTGPAASATPGLCEYPRVRSLASEGRAPLSAEMCTTQQPGTCPYRDHDHKYRNLGPGHGAGWG